MIAAAGGAGGRVAKIRTGGVTPEGVPHAERIAEVLVQCAQADVPFKATRGSAPRDPAHYPLTTNPTARGGDARIPEPVPRRGVRADPPLRHAGGVGLLEETDPRAIRFSRRFSLVARVGAEATRSWPRRARPSPFPTAVARSTEPVEELQRSAPPRGMSGPATLGP